MAKLSEIQEEWKLDCVINASDFTRESLRTPSLHSKYLDYYVSTKKLLGQYQREYQEEKRLMSKYYKGEFTQEELEAKGLDQYQYTKPLKTEMEEILKCDKFVVAKYERVEYLELSIQYLESVLSQIKARDWEIKNAIQWEIFKAGG